MGKGSNRRRKRGRSRNREPEEVEAVEVEDDDDGFVSGRPRKGANDWLKENVQFLVIGGSIVILIVAVIAISVFTPESPPEDPNGNGLEWQDMDSFQNYLGRSDYEYHKLSKTTSINSKASGHESSSLHFIVGVEEEFTGPEILSIKNFLDDGGTVIIAADGNYVNKLCQDQWEITLDGSQVIQESGWIYNLSFIPATAEVEGYRYSIMLNAPSGFTATGEAEIMARSEADGITVLDKNANYVQDMDDIYAPGVPFIIKLQAGSGTLVIISDAGLFTDKLFSDARFENMQFTTALLSSLIPDDGYVYYDHSKQVSQTSGHLILPE